MIRACVHESIHEMDPLRWDALLSGRSVTFSHAFWSVIEASALNDFRYRHVLFLDEDDRRWRRRRFTW